MNLSEKHVDRIEAETAVDVSRMAMDEATTEETFMSLRAACVKHPTFLETRNRVRRIRLENMGLAT